MRSVFVMGMLAALVVTGMSMTAFSQTVPRIKAVIISYQKQILTVMPVGEDKSIAVAIRPATRILRQEQKLFSDIKPGDFIGATVAPVREGVLRAQELHIFPDTMRGSGEGLYPVSPGSSRSVVNAIVSSISAGELIVRFRGAAGAGENCSGRAPIEQAVGPKGCEGMAKIVIAPTVPVLGLQVADTAALTQGGVVALSLMAGPDGKLVTPGLIIETVQTPPVGPGDVAPSRRTRTEARRGKAPGR